MNLAAAVYALPQTINRPENRMLHDGMRDLREGTSQAFAKLQSSLWTSLGVWGHRLVHQPCLQYLPELASWKG
jgi:hypothetical protein